MTADRADDAAPSVTVVIATRSRPELLRRAIDAVINQDYPGAIECVVVFDQAPVDESVCAGRTYGPRRRVGAIANSRTPGLAGARNAGIDAASGEIIAFCDDDDEWLPGKLALQVERLQATGSDVAVTGIEVRYGDRIVHRVPTAADLSVATLARRRVMEAHPSTVVVRADALRMRIGVVDEDIPGSYGEDYDWILRAAHAGPIAVVERPLVRVLWGRTSFFNRRWQTIIDAIDYVLAKHPVLSEDPHGLARLEGQKAFAYAALGQPRAALRAVGRVLRLNWREPRAYVTVVVALRLLSADRVLATANSFGRGI
ncbi:glycosyltransferase family A protein [Actinopolymorpha sp. B11F2]|uniref:glycosyltransferase family 2 protein n=1 Tax=Actinopolymorpha sp. B11F2 TaxID=3160862 RepID=UPI0032E377EB